MPTPYPYQVEGSERMIRAMDTHLGVLNADEMGLGKTAQTLMTLNRTPVERVLIVCPASLKLNWLREYEAWNTSGRVPALAYGDRIPLDAGTIIINYDILGRNFKPLLEWDPQIIVYDEAHYLKNPKSQRTQAALALPAIRRLFLTGTPIVNRPMELWPILNAIDEGRFKSQHDYGLRHCGAFQMAVKTKRGVRKVWNYSGASRLAELHQLIKPWVIRRLKRDVLRDLPPKTRQVIELSGSANLVAAEAEAWEQVCADVGYEAAVSQIEAGAGPAFADMSRVRLLLAMAKVRPAVEHIKNVLESEKKLVVFAHHIDVVDHLKEALAAFRPAVITGVTPTKRRQAEVDAFQSDPNRRVFIGNIRAAGVGLTLTAASTVVFVELDWTPGNMTQAEDRCHRIGQTDNVLVQHLVLSGSLDATMARKLIAKQKTADAVVDGIQIH